MRSSRGRAAGDFMSPVLFHALGALLEREANTRGQGQRSRIYRRSDVLRLGQGEDGKERTGRRRTAVEIDAVVGGSSRCPMDQRKGCLKSSTPGFVGPNCRRYARRLPVAFMTMVHKSKHQAGEDGHHEYFDHAGTVRVEMTIRDEMRRARFAP